MKPAFIDLVCDIHYKITFLDNCDKAKKSIELHDEKFHFCLKTKLNTSEEYLFILKNLIDMAEGILIDSYYDDSCNEFEKLNVKILGVEILSINNIEREEIFM